MADELRVAGFVGSSGFITLDGDETAARAIADPAAFPTILGRLNARGVRSQIKAMRTEHAMYADAAWRNIDVADRFNPTPAG